MVKLQIIKKENGLYFLKDEEEKEYEIVLEIHDIDEPEVGDFISFNNELLNQRYEGYSTFYAFGNLDNQYGKSDISLDDIDVIKIEKDNSEIVLKRLYG